MATPGFSFPKALGPWSFVTTSSAPWALLGCMVTCCTPHFSALGQGLWRGSRAPEVIFSLTKVKL